MIIDFVLVIAAIWLGSLFTYSGALKVLAEPILNARAVAGYKVLPDQAARLVGVALPYAELAVGSAILLTPYTGVGAWGAASFGFVFVLATGSVLIRGIETGCGCAGKVSDRVTAATFVRALLITAAAAALLVIGDARVPMSVGAIVFTMALVPAGVLWRRQHRHRRSHVHQRPHGPAALGVGTAAAPGNASSVSGRATPRAIG
ncbi:MAG TPA: MauE/DoxX family redox-associated membrane protein [Candidatus Limnocylindria bacterium]|jgi:hypothetical protein|nr:MauE/DoxX family redox-associated membrane protein [Candidatus Limnocylindria bacterium]